MSKKNKNAVTKFEVNLQPVPLGTISLNDFVSSKACDAALKVASEQENSDEKAFAFLCSYQFTEICNSVCQAGRPELLDDIYWMPVFNTNCYNWIVEPLAGILNPTTRRAT